MLVLLVVLPATCARAAPSSSGSKKTSTSSTCTNLKKCDFVTTNDVKWQTATFKVNVGGGGGTDDDDYGGGGGGSTAGTCTITDIRNRIGAVAWDCFTVESGASVASVGCPEGMTAVSVGCSLFSAGFFLPALGSSGSVQGDSASCAFPSRDLLEPEWSTFPYAIILNCAWNRPAPVTSGNTKAAATAAAAAASPAARAEPATVLKVKGRLTKKRG